MGIARTFQNIRLFQNMTALENVMVGRHTRTLEGPIGAVFRTPKFKREEKGTESDGAQVARLRRPGLGGNELAKNLPYGDQRRLEIARAMATEPTLLLLDEPAAGMNPQESQKLNGLIRTGARARHHRPAHRARHEGRHGHRRPHLRARLRRDDRRGTARRDPAQPAGHRGVSRQGCRGDARAARRGSCRSAQAVPEPARRAESMPATDAAEGGAEDGEE